MIIGINGKIGSGKDTIGSIMQCLMNHPKISNADLLYMINNNIVSETNKCEIKKFAGKLKTIASLLTGIPVEKFEDQEFKKTYLSEEWNSPYNIPFSGPDFVEHDGRMTVRELLQKLGTDAMRDNLHENVWVNALFADYKGIITEPAKFGGTAIGEYPNWVITDMRFPNEMDAVYKREGFTIRVVRDYALRGGPEDPKNQHPSETALDNSHFDYEIINDGTIEDLIEKVREILIKEDVI